MRIFILCAGLLLLLGLGCANAPSSRPSAGPGVPLRVFYCSWEATSPGAGFTHTQLAAFEVDLVRKQARWLVESRSAPEPMLPWQEEEMIALVSKEPVRQLSDEQAAACRELIEAWLATDPPATYPGGRGLGTEDGAVEKLTVFFAESERTVTVDVRSPIPISEGASPEWLALRAAHMRLIVEAHREAPSGL